MSNYISYPLCRIVTQGFYSEKDAARCVQDMLEAIKVIMNATIDQNSLYQRFQETTFDTVLWDHTCGIVCQTIYIYIQFIMSKYFFMYLLLPYTVALHENRISVTDVYHVN